MQLLVTLRGSTEQKCLGEEIVPRVVCAGWWWWCNGVCMFTWHTLGPLEPIGHGLNATAYPSIVSDHVHPFMATMYPSSDGYFQQDNAPCHKARILSNWFLEHDNEFTVLQWPPQSPDINPTEHLWDVEERELHALDVHPTHLHQLQDAILSIWATISKECFSAPC